MDQSIATAAHRLAKCRLVVVLTGAGIYASAHRKAHLHLHASSGRDFDTHHRAPRRCGHE